MRVIGGELKRRRLQAPAGLATRPSSDRLRETLFDILGGEVRGGVFVDAFAGTGAVGIEAWSRGARPVVWIETAGAALQQLRANLEGLGIAMAGGATVLARPVLPALPGLERLPGVAGHGCDFFFLDPPYADEPEYGRVLAELDRRPGLLAPGARVVAEAHRSAVLPEAVGGLWRERVHRVGDSALVFYRVSGGANRV